MNQLAQLNLGPSGGGFRGVGPLGLQPVPGVATEITAANTFASFISSAIGVMSVVATLWFVFQLFIGAISMIGANGDSKSMAAARSRITTAITGLIVVFVAYSFTLLLGILLGIPDILNFTAALTRITS